MPSPLSPSATPAAAGYAAAAAALSFAGVSMYWAAGGTAGLDTLGGEIEELARARDPQFIMLVWATVLLKVLGGILALALVQSWGRRLPRRLLLTISWGAAAVLTLYGAAQTATVGLFLLDVIDAPEGMSLRALRWRLLLWEPWFIVWGFLLGVAAWGYSRAHEEPDSNSSSVAN